ncbi:MAG: hypothetical protein ABJP82_07110 [Hyphomicrobiales bacterium]
MVKLLSGFFVIALFAGLMVPPTQAACSYDPSGSCTGVVGCGANAGASCGTTADQPCLCGSVGAGPCGCS